MVSESGSKPGVVGQEGSGSRRKSVKTRWPRFGASTQGSGRDQDADGVRSRTNGIRAPRRSIETCGLAIEAASKVARVRPVPLSIGDTSDGMRHLGSAREAGRYVGPGPSSANTTRNCEAALPPIIRAMISSGTPSRAAWRSRRALVVSCWG